MAKHIKIDVYDLRDTVEKLGTALENFRPYNKKFIKETSKKIDEANSDFIEEIQKVLKHMKDTKAPELVKKLDTIEELTKIMLDEFERVDDSAADIINEGGYY